MNITAKEYLEELTQLVHDRFGLVAADLDINEDLCHSLIQQDETPTAYLDWLADKFNLVDSDDWSMEKAVAFMKRFKTLSADPAEVKKDKSWHLTFYLVAIIIDEIRMNTRHQLHIRFCNEGHKAMAELATQIADDFIRSGEDIGNIDAFVRRLTDEA